jgi:hypothetical protein
VLEQPSKRTIQALATLDGDADFEQIKSWLKETLIQIQHDEPYTKDEIQTRWYQGASQTLTEFLNKASEARETLRKF